MFGKPRSVSLEFRVLHIPTGTLYILYPGQVKDFCECKALNYNSVMTARCKKPGREIPMYTFILSVRKQKGCKHEYYMLPANLAQIRP